MNSADVIRESAAYRGAGRFREAIDLVKESLPNFDPDIRFNAYHEMFLAAKEAGYRTEGEEYARKLLEFEPELPSATAYLAG